MLAIWNEDQLSILIAQLSNCVYFVLKFQYKKECYIIGLFFGNDRIDIALFCGWTKYNNSKYLKLAPVDKDKEGKAMECC